MPLQCQAMGNFHASSDIGGRIGGIKLYLLSGILDCVLPTAPRPRLRVLSWCESVLIFLTRRVRWVRTSAPTHTHIVR